MITQLLSHASLSFRFHFRIACRFFFLSFENFQVVSKTCHRIRSPASDRLCLLVNRLEANLNSVANWPRSNPQLVTGLEH